MSGTNKGTPSGSAAKVPGPAVPFLDRTGQVSPIWRAFFWSLGSQLSAVVGGQTIGNDITVLNLVGGLQGTVVGNQLEISAGAEWIFAGETFEPVAAVDVGPGLVLTGLQNGTIALSIEETQTGIKVLNNNDVRVSSATSLDFLGNVFVNENGTLEGVVTVPFLSVSGESEVPLLSPAPLDFTQVTEISFAGNAILSGDKALNYFGSEQFVIYGTGSQQGTVQYDGPAATVEFVASDGLFSIPGTGAVQMTIGSFFFGGDGGQQSIGGTLAWAVGGFGVVNQSNDIQNVFQYGTATSVVGTSTTGSLLVLPDIVPNETLGYVLIGVFPEVPTPITIESSLGVFTDIGTFTGTNYSQGAVFISSFASNGTLDATVALGTSTSFGVITGTVFPQYLDTNSGTVTVTVPFTTLALGTTALTTELLTLDVGQGLTGSGSGVTGTIDLSLTALDGTVDLGTFFALEAGTNISGSNTGGTFSLAAYSQFVDGTVTLSEFGLEAGPNVDFLASGNFAEIYIEPALIGPFASVGGSLVPNVQVLELPVGSTVQTYTVPFLGPAQAGGYFYSINIKRSLASSTIVAFSYGGVSPAGNMETAITVSGGVGAFFGDVFGVDYSAGNFGGIWGAELFGVPNFGSYTPTIGTSLVTTAFTNSSTLDELLLFAGINSTTFSAAPGLIGASLISNVALQSDGGQLFVGEATLTPGQTLGVTWNNYGTFVEAVFLEATLAEPLTMVSVGGGGGSSGLVFVDGTVSLTSDTLEAGPNIAFTGTSGGPVTISASASLGSGIEIIDGNTVFASVETISVGDGLTASPAGILAPYIVQSATLQTPGTSVALVNPVTVGNFLIAVVGGVGSISGLPVLGQTGGGLVGGSVIQGEVAATTLAPTLIGGANVFYAEVGNYGTFAVGTLTPSTSGTLTTAIFDNTLISENLLLFAGVPNANIAGGVVTVVAPAQFTAPYVYPIYPADNYGMFLGEVPTIGVGTTAIEWEYGNTFTTSMYAFIEGKTVAGAVELSSGLALVDGTFSATASTLTAGGNIAFTGTGPDVTISATGGGGSLEIVSGTTTVASVSEIVLGANLSLVTSTSAGVLTLEASGGSGSLTIIDGTNTYSNVQDVEIGNGLTVAAGAYSTPTIVQSQTYSGGTGSFSLPNPVTVGNFLVVVQLGNSVGTGLPVLETIIAGPGYTNSFIYGETATSTLAPEITLQGNGYYYEITGFSTYSSGFDSPQSVGTVSSFTFSNSTIAENLLISALSLNNTSPSSISSISPADATYLTAPYVGGNAYGGFVAEVPNLPTGSTEISWSNGQSYVDSAYIFFVGSAMPGAVVLNATLNFSGTTATTATAGTASALPASPSGYLEVTINGTAAKLPFYGV